MDIKEARKYLNSRVRRIELSPDSLALIISKGVTIKVRKGLPWNGSIVKRASYDVATDKVILIVNNPEFSPVPEGELPPILDVILEVKDPEEDT